MRRASAGAHLHADEAGRFLRLGLAELNPRRLQLGRRQIDALGDLLV
jgi:hypothetical protein